MRTFVRMTALTAAPTVPAMPSSSRQTIEVPPAGLRFAAPVALAAASAGARRFSGVAYSGNVITDHGYWEAVTFDLAGVTAAAPMPLLLQHDQDRQIGVIDSVVNDGQQIAIGGKLFTGIDPSADAVAAKADAGAPWQMSVGIFPDRIENTRPTDGDVSVNGRPVPGGTTIFRSARVREVSFVALGADPATRALVFNAGGNYVAELVNQKEPPVSDTNSEAAAQLAAVTAELGVEKAARVAAETKLSELQEQFAAHQRAEREACVKQLLGDEGFSAEKAKPYIDMTPEQFAAVQAAMGALKSRMPEGFTSEKATQGQPASKALTADAITKFRREHPGASYEQAFAALKGVNAAALPQHF